MKKTFLIAAVLLVALIAAFPFVKKKLMGGNSISISMSDNQHEFSISAEFPDQKSGAVQSYLRRELELKDLPDIRNVEVQNYQTTSGQMSFSIKAESGYVRLSMDKDLNNDQAYLKMRKTGEGLKAVLTH